MISTDMWQTHKSLDIFLLALFMWSHSFLKLHFEVLSEKKKIKVEMPSSAWELGNLRG